VSSRTLRWLAASGDWLTRRKQPGAGNSEGSLTSAEASELDGDAGFNDLLMAGQRDLRRKRFKSAIANYERAEAVLGASGNPNLWVVVRNRRAAALMSRHRWQEALSVYDELISEREILERVPREVLPDEVAAIYSGRALCLEKLGRLNEARDALPALIEEIGTGTGPNQQHFLADAYVLQARAAAANGQLTQSLAAIAAATALCSGVDDPGVRRTLRDAQALERSVRARVSKGSKRA
jgi:tetratricopeptide (TPR) repeat protein